MLCWFFFFQAEDGIRDADVTGVQTCALPIWRLASSENEAKRRRCTWQCDRLREASRDERSEERRVGKECRSRGWPDHEKKKEEDREKQEEHKGNRNRTIKAEMMNMIVKYW